MVHYQVISPGHSEVISLINTTAEGDYKTQLLGLKGPRNTFPLLNTYWCQQHAQGLTYINVLNPLTALQELQ